MKVSRSKPCSYKERRTVKRMLLVLGAAVICLSTLVTPSIARTDGGGNGTTGCGSTICKP